VDLLRARLGAVQRVVGGGLSRGRHERQGGERCRHGNERAGETHETPVCRWQGNLTNDARYQSSRSVRGTDLCCLGRGTLVWSMPWLLSAPGCRFRPASLVEQLRPQSADPPTSKEIIMANYVLAYSGGSMPETEEAGAAVMASWGAWLGGLGDAIVDGGNPFGPSASISADGSVSDGGSAHLTGYSIVKADSLDAATTLVKDCPALSSGGSVDVYETIEM
jgi:hypothetical protein